MHISYYTLIFIRIRLEYSHLLLYISQYYYLFKFFNKVYKYRRYINK